MTPVGSPPAPEPSPTAAAVAGLPRVSVVMVAYGPEDWLERAVHAVLASEKVEVEVVLVDNGGTEGRVERLAGEPGVQVVRPSGNVGFTTGCNLGVAASTFPLIALINPDAICEPDTIAELVAVASEPAVGLATGSVRLADDPTLLNSAGNIVHFLGVSWSGYFNEPATDHPDRRVVAAASGGAMAFRRDVWDALGGFCDEFFAYCEDADLSLRCWQRGWTVVYVPSAVVIHKYEFSRHPVKYRLLERNRVSMAVSCFSTRHLLLVAPLLLGLEVMSLALAAKQGWLREKFVAYLWLLRHLRWLAARRRRVQAERTDTSRTLVNLYSDRLRPENIELPAFVEPADKILAWYWRRVRRFA